MDEFGALYIRLAMPRHNIAKGGISDPIHGREADDRLWQCVPETHTPGVSSLVARVLTLIHSTPSLSMHCVEYRTPSRNCLCSLAVPPAKSYMRSSPDQFDIANALRSLRRRLVR